MGVYDSNEVHMPQAISGKKKTGGALPLKVTKKKTKKKSKGK